MKVEVKPVDQHQVSLLIEEPRYPIGSTTYQQPGEHPGFP